MDQNRGSWPVDANLVIDAGEVPLEAYREAASNYFEHLKRTRREKDIELSLAATSTPETLADIVAPARIGTKRVEVGGMTKPALRSRRAAVSYADQSMILLRTSLGIQVDHC
jgi:hypothetical protein